MKINLQRIDVPENEDVKTQSIKNRTKKGLDNIKIAQIAQKDVIPNRSQYK